MTVVVVDRTERWPIDPSDHNFIHSIKPMFPRSISFIQVVHVGKEVFGTRDVARGRCSRTCRAGRSWWCSRA
jgi:hypothetical protein